MSDSIDGEFTEVPYSLTEDRLKNIKWRTADGEIILLGDINDTHLRNIALFLMGMGYRTCIASSERRIQWLAVIRMEWERRRLSNRFNAKTPNQELIKQ